MIPLPDYLLLNCVEHLEIDSFLAFRSVCRKYHALVEAHMTGLTEAVAATTFPSQTRVLQYERPPLLASSKDRLRWLTDLRYYQLASILYEQSKTPTVAAEDPLADQVRTSGVKGWKVLRRLSKIEEEVGRLTPDQLRASYPGNQTDLDENDEPVELAKMQQLETCRRRCQYVESLPSERLQAFWDIVWFFRHIVFGYTSEIEEPRRTSNEPETLGMPSPSWALAQVMRDGPEVFWQFWWRDREQEGRDRLALKHKYEEAWRSGGIANAESSRDVEALMQLSLSAAKGSRQMTLVYTLGSRMIEAERIERSRRRTFAVAQRNRRTEKGEAEPRRVFDNLPIKQHLGYKSPDEAQYLTKREIREGGRYPSPRFPQVRREGRRQGRKTELCLHEYSQLKNELGEGREERLDLGDQVELQQLRIDLPEKPAAARPPRRKML